MRSGRSSKYCHILMGARYRATYICASAWLALEPDEGRCSGNEERMSRTNLPQASEPGTRLSCQLGGRTEADAC